MILAVESSFSLGLTILPSKNICISQLNLQCTINPDKMSTMDYLSVYNQK